jgi:hypothetical protein
MSAAYKTLLLEKTELTLNEGQPEYLIVPLGTFAGTIEKVLYRCNGTFVPSDTSDQLIGDGLR